MMPWGALGHGWRLCCGAGWQDPALTRAELARGRVWGSVCVSCFPPAVLPPGRPCGLSPSLCHLQHLRKSLWTSRYESYLDPVSASGNHGMEISLCFRSYGWAPREQEPARAGCSGPHELCLGHRRRHFVLVHILDYQLVHLCTAI